LLSKNIFVYTNPTIPLIYFHGIFLFLFIVTKNILNKTAIKAGSWTMSKSYKDWIWQKKFSPKPTGFVISVFNTYCTVLQEATKMWITEEHEKLIISVFNKWHFWGCPSIRLPV